MIFEQFCLSQYLTYHNLADVIVLVNKLTCILCDKMLNFKDFVVKFPSI